MGDYQNTTWLFYVFGVSASDIAEAINLSLACSVSLLYNHNYAFQCDGIVYLIRCCQRLPFI